MMNDSLVTPVVTILTAIIGLAVIAVLVSNHANTGNVLSSGGNAFASILKAATAPVSGGGFSMGGFGG